MHRVRRNDPGKRLSNLLEKWKKQLTDIINTADDNIKTSEIVSDFWSGRGKETLKRELIKMMGSCCCYCENHVRFSAAHIEHRLPKSKFPDLTFDYNNLHYSCSVCNTKKLDKHDEKNPVLDTCKDAVEEHIVPDDVLPYRFKFLTPRAITTDRFVNLNDEELLELRRKVYQDIQELIRDIHDDNIELERRDEKKRILMEKARHGSRFCSVARAVIKRNRHLFPDFNIREWEFELKSNRKAGN